jgi:hypothetical protein
MRKFSIFLLLIAIAAIFSYQYYCFAANPSFKMIFRYGCGSIPNELNTFDGTYTKDLIDSPPITIPLTLSEEEIGRIIRKMEEIRFFEYPDEFSLSKMPPAYRVPLIRQPAEGRYFKVEYGSRRKELKWDDGATSWLIEGEVVGDKKAEELAELVYLIKEIISAKEEVRRLPPVVGGYE